MREEDGRSRRGRVFLGGKRCDESRLASFIAAQLLRVNEMIHEDFPGSSV